MRAAQGAAEAGPLMPPIRSWPTLEPPVDENQRPFGLVHLEEQALRDDLEDLELTFTEAMSLMRKILARTSPQDDGERPPQAS